MFNHTFIAATATLILLAGPALAGDHAKHNMASPLANVVGSYGQLRAALAADSLAGAQKAAAGLAAAAGKAKVAAEHKRTLAEVGKWAAKVAAAKDMAAARMDFGQTSRQLITLLVAHPRAATGLTAYRCPMASGYKKWVQSGDMANPYMGARMLRCGGKTKMEP